MRSKISEPFEIRVDCWFDCDMIWSDLGVFDDDGFSEIVGGYRSNSRIIAWTTRPNSECTAY